VLKEASAMSDLQPKACSPRRDCVISRLLCWLALGVFGACRSGPAACAELNDAKLAKLAPLDLDKNIRFTPSPVTAALPPSFSAANLSIVEPRVFSATEFCPRKRSFLESTAPARTDTDKGTLLGTTTVWQRLNDYRSRDRVRVVTLWESTGSSVSLQAGKKGDPSLQWSSKLMNHGGATRGVLDKLLAVSIAGARGDRSASSAPTTASRPR
jgi:hypothetical protein